ncbi:hypothetical protein [Rubidibacter lacunae]|nr:hypothetical protein [Rubidibacter lacunae]
MPLKGWCEREADGSAICSLTDEVANAQTGAFDMSLLDARDFFWVT